MNPVYLDYNATSPLRPEAREAMLRVMDRTGNASSIHNFGREARREIEAAREKLGALCGVMPSQIVFTAGATESNNAVLATFRGERIATSSVEHPSVLEAATDAVRIVVGADGLIDTAAFDSALNEKPALLSLMLVNNETGIIQDVANLAARARAMHPQIHIHTDAVQAAGRIPIDFGALHVDYMSLSAHKIGGPQGVGALIAAPGAKPARLLFGGGQEKSMRAGTENVAGIAGFGAAAQAALDGLGSYGQLAALRDSMEHSIRTTEPRAVIIGAPSPRVANTSMIALPGIPAQTQLMALDLAGIAISSGSACSSGTVKASHVLQAMGLPDAIAGCAIRVSMGLDTTQNDIDRFIAAWQAMQARMQDRVGAVNS